MIKDNLYKKGQVDQQLFQSLIENNPQAITVFNEKGVIKMINARFAELFGYQIDEVVGQQVSVLFPKDKIALLDRVIEELLREPTFRHLGTEFNLKAKRKDDTLFFCELALNPVKIDNRVLTIASIIDITSFYTDQKALLENKEQLTSIMDNLPGMIFRLNNDEVFTLRYISGNSLEYLGISEEEIKQRGLRPRDVIPYNYLEMVRGNIRYAVENDTRSEATFPIVIKNNTRWLRARFKPTRLKNNEKVIDGLLIDVTSQIESHERLSISIDAVRQGMWDWDINTNAVMVNTFQARMIGFSPNEVGNTFEWWADRVHPKDVDSLYKEMIRHLKDEVESFESELRLKTKTNAYKWVMVRGKVIQRDADGKAVRVMGVQLDIDNRKKMELDLVKSQSRLQALIANLPGMVYRSSLKDSFSISYASVGAKALTGYPSQDFTSGKITLFQLIVPAQRAAVKKEVDLAIKERRPYDIIYEIETIQGKKWVNDKGQEIERGFLQGFLTDISDRIRSEEKVLSTVIETEDRERKRIAQELHDNLGQKLTTASLNFNALKSMLPNDELILRAESGLKYLTEAINDARNISHDLMPRSVEGFGFVVAVESMIADLNRVSDTNFEFYHNLKEKRLNDTLDVNLYRITQEAVNNTMKHAKATQAIIQLMAYDDVIIWSIEDNGSGFDSTVTHKKKTFGLDGIKHRTQILGGNLEVNSQPGKGTMITIELPAKKHFSNE